MQLSNKIARLLIGIRFARCFRINDTTGEIIDHILYSKSTPFGEKFFPHTRELVSREKILYNQDTGNFFRVNSTDIILGIKIDNDYNDKFTWIKDDVVDYLEKVFATFKIKNILRTGIIFSHSIERSDEMEQSILKITDSQVSSLNSMNLSFSKKMPVTKSMALKEDNDYKNAIYSFELSEEGIIADLDYQYYHHQMIENLKDCQLKEFLDIAETFKNNEYYKWLDQYVKEK